MLKLQSLWQFSRPHTIVGTSLSLFALLAIALNAHLAAPDFSQILAVLLWAWLACLAGNLYIVGLNQLFDVEIDRINKPHLPLAAGEFSQTEAQSIVAIAGLLSLVICLTQGLFLSLTVISSLIIGTAYSAPPLRLKRFPIWASICILSVRGAIVNLGLFLHFQQKLGDGVRVLPSIWLLTIFVLIFSYAIAIFKDMPDTEGDAKYQVATLTLSWGRESVFLLSKWLLLALYTLMAIALVGLRPTEINYPVLAVSQVVIAITLYQRSYQVDLSDQSSIASFYQFIWRLFYLEYVIFPVACWLA